jgi:hypothetical protein
MQIKAWYESKIVWVNVITAVVMILDLISQQPFIPPEYLPLIATAIGILNIVLRVFFTDTGIASKKARAARQT